MNIKTKNKISLHLLKIFHEISDEDAKVDLKELEDTELAVMSPCNVMMIVAKTLEAKKLLRDFYDKDNPTRLVTVDYENNKGLPQSGYNKEYLKWIIDLFSIMDGKRVVFTLGNDYPLTAENEHFKVIVAPLDE